MYDRELFQKVVKHCGLTKYEPVTEEAIEEAQEQLGLRFPYDYINFIKDYGEGGIPGTYIFGIDESYYTMVKHTERYREQYNIPKEYIAVIHRKNSKIEEWIIFLDTSRMKDGLCPAVRFDVNTSEITEYAENFDEVVDKEMMDLYLTFIKPYEDEEEINLFLPDGMGYKSVWMLIKGSNQRTIANRILNGEIDTKEYKAGVREVYDANNKALVTADYEDKNYVIMPLTEKYFNQDWIEKNCADFPECYAFLTERITETHGFLKAVNGKIVRYYYQDEEDITDIGKPMTEEQMNQIELPHDYKEYWENLRQDKMVIDEDIIMTIALEAGGVEDYPYDDVVVGELIK